MEDYYMATRWATENDSSGSTGSVSEGDRETDRATVNPILEESNEIEESDSEGDKKDVQDLTHSPINNKSEE